MSVKQPRLVGQAVKTSASHAENMGSIPVRVTKKEIGTPKWVPISFFVLRTKSNPAHIKYKLPLKLMYAFKLKAPLLYLLPCAWVRLPPLAVFCVMRRRKLPWHNAEHSLQSSPRIANSRTFIKCSFLRLFRKSRTSLPLGLLPALKAISLTKPMLVSPSWQYTATRYAPEVRMSVLDSCRTDISHRRNIASREQNARLAQIASLSTSIHQRSVYPYSGTPKSGGFFLFRACSSLAHL